MNGSFYKYHGAGNDFILFDNRLGDFNLDQAAIVRLCDRRFGVGADGLMTLNQSSDSDFHLDYYNADGSLGSLCGNGSRCAVALAHQLQMIGEETQFSAADGFIRLDWILQRFSCPGYARCKDCSGPKRIHFFRHRIST